MTKKKIDCLGGDEDIIAFILRIILFADELQTTLEKLGLCIYMCYDIYIYAEFMYDETEEGCCFVCILVQCIYYINLTGICRYV